MKWIYRDNYGVIVNEDQEALLKDYFTSDKPEDSKKLQVLPVQTAMNMVVKAVESVKEEPKEEEKPKDTPKKRTRRTKAQIEADKLAGK